MSNVLFIFFFYHLQVLTEKRHLGSKDGPPHLVVLVALHSRAITKNLLDLIQVNEGGILQEVDGKSCSFALICPKQKQRWCFIEANKGENKCFLVSW